MKDDRLALVDAKIHRVELGERQEPRAGNLLAGVLVRLADVDQDGAVVEQTPGLGWFDCGK